jgi:hypothetical protein
MPESQSPAGDERSRERASTLLRAYRTAYAEDQKYSEKIDDAIVASDVLYDLIMLFDEEFAEIMYHAEMRLAQDEDLTSDLPDGVYILSIEEQN